MRKRILLFTCILASLAAIISALLIHFIIYRDYEDRTRQSLVTEAGYISIILESGDYDYIGDLDRKITDHRLTLIDPDGVVIYDSDENPEVMENHNDRPEVIAARESGSGESTRHSDTISTQTYYYALELSDGTVLRVANTTDSVLSSLVRIGLLTLFVIALVIVFAFIIGSRVTRRIVKPVNELNLDSPEENDTYPELSPLLTRLTKQNDIIKKQVREIRDRQNEFQVLTEHMREGLILFDKDGFILSCNQSALQLLQAPHGDYVGKNVLSLSRTDTFRDSVESLMSGKELEIVFEIHQRHLQLIANPIIEKQKVRGGVIVLLDVTERLERDKLRREFTANVSHELKTPLTSVSGYAELIAEGIAKQDDIKDFAGNIYREAQRMISMIGDIMLLSKLDESQQEMQKEPVDLFAVATQVTEQLTPRAQKHNIKLNLSGESAIIDGIPIVLHEMLYNLTDNAIKYNKENGSIDISVNQTPSQVVLRVSDTGIGIARSEHERIFERFYRVDKSRGSSIEGTGLGLSILKHGAALHSAHVELESSEGEGSVFTISFDK